MSLIGSEGARVYRTDLDGDVVIGQSANAGQILVAARHGDGVPGDQAAADSGPQPVDSPNHRRGRGDGRTHTHGHHQPVFP